MDAEFWDCIKHNISNISEVFEWIRIIDEPINIDFDIEYEYLNVAQDLLPNEPWNIETWDQWILENKRKNRKKRQGFIHANKACFNRQNKWTRIK